MPSMEAGLNTARVERRALDRLRNAAPYAVTLVCAGLFSFLSGGYIFARSAPLAIVYLLLAAVWVWFLRRGSRPSQLYLAALAVFGLFVAWTGLSVAWSFGPDLSWVAFDLAALYLAAAAVLGLTPVGGLQLRIAGYGFLAVAVAVAVYAFLGKVAPDVVTHAHTYARLDSPVGYWNVLALMMVMGLAVALALAGDRHAHPVWRVSAAAAAVPLCFTFFFTLSRGGFVALAVMLVLYFSFTTTRLAGFASLVAIVAPVAAVLWHLRDLGTLYSATADDALRTLQGHALLRWSLAALLVTAAAQAVIVLGHCVVPWPRWVRLAAGAAVVLVLVAGIGGGSWRFLDSRGGLVWVEDRVQTFIAGTDETDAAEGTGRLISLNTGRPPLWREALEQSRSHRLRGTGAGTFVFTHDRFREGGGDVRHAHSQWFNVLSELGAVGLGLFAVAMALFIAAAVRNPFADRRDPLRPLLVALQAGMVAFVVHISWDWDWDMAAIGVVFFLFAAACSSYLATKAADRRRDDEAVAGEAASEAEGPGSAEAARTAPARPRRRRRVAGADGGHGGARAPRRELARAVSRGEGRERGSRRLRRRRYRRRPEPRASCREPRPARRGPADHSVAGAATAGAQRRGVGGAREGGAAAARQLPGVLPPGRPAAERLRPQEGRRRRAAACSGAEPLRRRQSLRAGAGDRAVIPAGVRRPAGSRCSAAGHCGPLW